MAKIFGAVFLFAACLWAELPDSVKTLLPGSGTWDDPFVIRNQEGDWDAMIDIIWADSSGYYHFKLETDLVVDYSYNTTRCNGKICGRRPRGAFHFDGGFHKITGETHPWTATGLFSMLKSGTIIENLELENVDVEAMYVGGGLVDTCQGPIHISDVVVTGNVKCSRNCGGVIGHAAKGTTISNVVNKASVKGKYNVGGIVGEMEKGGKLVNVANYGKISPYDSYRSGYFGGIAGKAYSIKSAYNRGEVRQSENIGGIAGKAQSVSYVYNVGPVSVDSAGVEAPSEKNIAGAVIGEFSIPSDTSERKALMQKGLYYEEGSFDWGIIGKKNWFRDVVDSGKLSHDELVNDAFLEKLGGFFVADSSGENDGYPVFKKFLEGRGSSDEPFLLNNREDLLIFNRLMADTMYAAYYSRKQYKLTNDIALEATDVWMPTPFYGFFNGNNHTISGLFARGLYSGLFSEISGALIKDLGIVDSHIEGTFSGAIAGRISNSDIENCWNANTFVYGDVRAGGIVGMTNSTGGSIVINRTYNTGKITGGGYVGGIAGEFYQNNNKARFVLANSFNRGRLESTIYGNFAYISGITNAAHPGSEIIRNVYNAGPIVFEDEGMNAPWTTYRLLGSDWTYRFENGWRLKASAVDSARIALTKEDMRSREFAKVMGEAFAYDSLNVNDGYPMLSGKKVPWNVETNVVKKISVLKSLRISILSNDIVVNGLNRNQNMVLVDLKGRKIWSGRSEGTTQVIPVPNRGVYLLKTEHSTSKIFVK